MTEQNGSNRGDSEDDEPKEIINPGELCHDPGHRHLTRSEAYGCYIAYTRKTRCADCGGSIMPGQQVDEDATSVRHSYSTDCKPKEKQ